KRERERFSVEQVQQMEQVFERTPRPSSGEKEKMAKDFNTPKRRIQVWFQNRRSKSKRQGRPSTSTSDHASSFMDNTAQS
ncbi:Homeodomain-like protein, partial [Chlamydoabsidia padenii]